MMNSLRKLALAAALALTVGFGGCAHAGMSAPGECRLTTAAALPVRNVRNFILVPVRLNGQERMFLVDTGAQTSTLTPETAAALRLPRDGTRATVLVGVSGSVRVPNVLVKRFDLGRLTLADKSFGVGAIPAFPGVTPAVAGLLGADVLSAYDVDLDLPRARLTLYAAQGCADYQPFPARVAVPLHRSHGGLAFLDAVVNGRSVRALLDTGARTTLLSRSTAAGLGVTDAALAGDPRRRGQGIGLGAIDLHQHRFAEFGLPGNVQRDVAVDVGDMHLPGVEMLLGADYLSARRTWISYSTGRLFVS
jgi:predicted aspartyl protease